MRYKVTYRGFLQTVERYFDTKERAIQWARQVGKFKECTITAVELKCYHQ